MADLSFTAVQAAGRERSEVTRKAAPRVPGLHEGLRWLRVTQALAAWPLWAGTLAGTWHWVLPPNLLLSPPPAPNTRFLPEDRTGACHTAPEK